MDDRPIDYLFLALFFLVFAKIKRLDEPDNLAGWWFLIGFAILMIILSIREMV